MDTTKIKSIFKLFDADVDYGDVNTFQAELNRLCNIILVPAAIVAIVSWLPYIPLDKNLYLEINIIILIRLGFTLTGIVTLLLHFTPFFKKGSATPTDKGPGSGKTNRHDEKVSFVSKLFQSISKIKSYWLLFSLICYLELASAVIAGLVAADAAYMGGYAMLILVVPLMPFKKNHAIIMLSSSLILFMITGFTTNIKFESLAKTYGWYNLIIASIASVIAIFVLDNMRKVNYEKNQLNYLTNMKLKVATMEIFQINEELKKANTLKSKLLEIAANDLKKPLQDIINCTHFLLKEVKEDQPSVKRLDIIYRSTDNMIRLISKLLKSLSIESGKLKLKKTDIDLGRLAESVIKDNKPYLDKKHQKIFFTAQDKCIVNGDEMLLKEVFDNLLSNAVKFSYPGKSIWITISHLGPVVSFKIRDEGPGLSNDDKEKLFTRFQKLSARPTGGELSTGLGLAITRDLVEMHNGKIKVESEAGQGCAFILEFPKAAD